MQRGLVNFVGRERAADQFLSFAIGFSLLSFVVSRQVKYIPVGWVVGNTRVTKKEY